MSSDQEAAGPSATEAPTDTMSVGRRHVVGLRPLSKARKAKIRQSEVTLNQIVDVVARGLPGLAADGQWAPLLRATQFLLWLTHHAPGAAAMFIAAKGTARVQDVVRAAAGCDDPVAVGVLQPATALLLVCVRLSETAADMVVESQSVRLLLQLLTRRDIGPTTKRHTGDILQALAAAKLVYRDVLHGAGVVDALMSALTDAAVIADLLLLQKLLWVLISLSDDDVVYKDDMREAGLPAVMAALFSVYQANQGAAELRPIAAQILRCLHLMAHDDHQMRTTCRQLGLIPLLVNQLHLDIHQMDEPPLPAAAANILSLNSLPGTPRSPVKSVPTSTGGAASPFNPGSPLRRTGSSGSGSSSPRAVTTAGGRRASAVEPPIPEDSEMQDIDIPDSPAANANGGGLWSGYGGRSAGYPHSSEAAALRGLGAGPSAVSRVAAAVLLREVLGGVMSARTVEVLLHGMLLPALYMQLVGPRLSLAQEATSTLLALLTDSPDNQAAAVKAGAVPLLVQLLSVRNIELASTAAEVITLIADSGTAAAASTNGSKGALGSHTAAAVLGLAELLKECAAQAYALGFGRRKSFSERAAAAAAAVGSGSISDRRSMAPVPELSLSPVHETAETLDSEPSSSRSNNGQYASVGLGLLASPTNTAAAAAEQVASIAWSSSSQQQQQRRGLILQSSIVFRHPSLNRDAPAAAASTKQQQQQLSSTDRRLSLSSRDRISCTSIGMAGGSCLVCSHDPHEHCGFCPLSSTVIALCTLLTPIPQLQQQLLDAGCVEVLVGLMAGEVCHGADHTRLLGALAHLAMLAVKGNSQAQDQVRQAGGVDIVSEALERVATTATAAASVTEDTVQLCVALLQLLSALVAGNSANKLSVREAGAFKAVATLLNIVLQQSGPTLEHLSQAILHFLITALPDSPGCQTEAHQQGTTGKLLTLLRKPTDNHSVGYLCIEALALLGNKHQPGALSEVTAGGLVAVVMNVLQQQAMAGVLVSEVCMNALPSLLDGNPAGKTQALGYGVLPLLVHLLRSSPSAATVAAAARTLAVLAERNTELQGQIISAGGLHALLDKLDPANAAAAAANAAAVQAAAAAASAAAEAAVEAVAKAAADSSAVAAAGDAAAGSSSSDAGGAAVVADGDADEQQQQQQQPALPQPAAGIFKAVTGSSTSASNGSSNLQQQQQTLLGPEQVALLDAQARLAQQKVRVACLEAVAALAHDNMFTKNTARQQGVMLLLVDLLSQGKLALQKSVTMAAAARQQHQHQHLGSDLGTPRSSSLRVRTPRSSLGSQPQTSLAAGASSKEQQMEQHIQAAQLQVLVTAVNVVKELCHGAHSNQQAAAAEGLIDQLTAIAAMALGSSLEAAAVHRVLLAAVCDALSAVCEFCFPNKLVARECGGVEVLSRVILIAAEAPDMSILSSLHLHTAVASCCSAVVALAQDCDEDQRSFTANADFLPALFRLLSVNDPALATQAARALEFIAIRNDYADDADDRSEFEADTIMALIRTLSHGAIAISGSGRTAAARVAIGGAAATPAAAVIKEAADLLARVADASDPAVLAPPAAAAAGAASSSSSSAVPSRIVSGLGTAPAHPTGPPSAANSQKHLQTGGSVKQRQETPPPPTAAAAGSDGVDVLSPQPAALLPAVVMDHTSGLAVLRTWSMQEDVGGMWQALVARTAPAFQPITAAVAEGPWKPFKLQISWMLLLLAAKNPNNRAIISKVQRTTLSPLAMQLENAERFYQQAAEVEAAAAVAAAAAGRSVGRSSSTGAVAAAAANPSSSSSRGSAGGYAANSRGSLTSVVSAPAGTTEAAVAAAAAPDTAAAAAPGQASSNIDDDELSMLQAEVAFLGLMSGGSSGKQESRSSSNTGADRS